MIGNGIDRRTDPSCAALLIRVWVGRVIARARIFWHAGKRSGYRQDVEVTSSRPKTPNRVGPGASGREFSGPALHVIYALNQGAWALLHLALWKGRGND